MPRPKTCVGMWNRLIARQSTMGVGSASRDCYAADARVIVMRCKSVQIVRLWLLCGQRMWQRNNKVNKVWARVEGTAKIALTVFQGPGQCKLPASGAAAVTGTTIFLVWVNLVSSTYRILFCWAQLFLSSSLYCICTLPLCTPVSRLLTADSP